MSDLSKPMMSDFEISIIDTIIESRKPKTCLEWGSGGSTIYFPNKHQCIESWVSIEHDQAYYDIVRKSVHAKVTMVYANIAEYLSIVKQKEIKADLILIDGLMRQECLWFCKQFLNKGGIVLLHDSARSEYQKAIKSWDGQKTELSQGEGEIRGFAHRGLYMFEEQHER